MAKKLDFNKISVHEGPERSPGYLLWRVSTAWRGSIEAELSGIDLTHPQFVVLAAVGWLTRKGARVTQAAVGKMAGLDPNTTSQIIKGLERKELLIREPSSDGRVKHPILTAKGNKSLVKAIPAVEKADERFFANLGSEELECMMASFQKLLHHFQS